ncbi:MAG: DUF2726 domain-containing protein [Deinococcales bacterium]
MLFRVGLLQSLLSLFQKPNLAVSAVEKSSSLLSPAEKELYLLLRRELNDDFEIFSKVQLAEILQVSGLNFSGRKNLEAEHVDFVLCDPKTLEPKLVIECVGHSKSFNPFRRQREAFVDASLDQAKLPIMHVALQQNYQTDALIDRIYDKIALYSQRQRLVEVEVLPPLSEKQALEKSKKSS